MNNIKIILTSALVDDNNKPLSHTDQNPNLNLENRMKEYSENFNKMSELGYKFQIIETFVERSTFLESYSNVFYSNVNNKNFVNRGSNFVIAMKKYLNSQNFNDDDLIIHVTGRYLVIDSSFFEQCIKLEKNKLGIFKKDSFGQFFLFMFGLRFGVFKKIMNEIFIDELEIQKNNLELLFSKKLNHTELFFTDYLGIIGRQSNSPNNEYGKQIF